MGFLAGRDGEARPTDVAALAEVALADPDNTHAALADPQGIERAEVVVDDRSGTGFVVLDEVAPLPPGQTLQLWDLGGPTPVSLGVLGDGATRALAVPLPTDRSVLAITAEAAPGAPRPTGPIVARGVLPASQ
jgi:anti-sigma-K factor RskA